MMVGSTGSWLVAILVLLVVPDPGSPALNPETKQKIDEFIEQILTCRDIVGINLAIVQGTEILLTTGYGQADMESGQPVTNQTLFGLASVSKAFTTTLLAKILQRNIRYNWDTPVRDILGEDFYFYDGLRTNRTTLRDLAAHKTGLASNNDMRFQRPTKEQLAQKMQFLPPHYEFRSNYLYHNLLYGLLAYATEVMGGDTWENLMHTFMFQPIGMTSSSFTHVADLYDPDVAKAYLDHEAEENHYRQVSPEFHKLWGEIGGAGSILSNADDMAKWMLFQLNGGRNQVGDQVLREKLLQETHDPLNVIPMTSSYENYQRPTIPVTYYDRNYAMGWRAGFYRGVPMVSHTGTSFGYGALQTLLPDERIGIYTSISGPDAGYTGRRLIHMYIMDLLRGEEPWLDLTSACTFPQPWVPMVLQVNPVFRLFGHPKPNTAEYVGTYGNFLYGNITFTVNEEDVLEMHYGDLGHWILHATSNNHDFYGEGKDDLWFFSVDGIIFASSTGVIIDEVIIWDFDQNTPPMFKRDLKMSEAPPPPDPGSCGETPYRPSSVYAGSAAIVHTSSLLVCLLLARLWWEG